MYIYRLLHVPVSRGSLVFHNNSKIKSNKNNLNLKHYLKSYSIHLQDIAPYANTIASDLDTLCSDSSTKFIYKYKSQRCQMRNIFSVRDKVLSTASKRFS